MFKLIKIAIIAIMIMSVFLLAPMTAEILTTGTLTIGYQNHAIGLVSLMWLTIGFSAYILLRHGSKKNPLPAAMLAAAAIDNKYTITAFNPANGKHHDSNDAFLFLAKDIAVPDTLRFYHDKCKEHGSPQGHLDAITGLIQRVERYQSTNGSKVPDTGPLVQIQQNDR